MSPRAPLTEEQREVLRHRLAQARQKKKDMGPQAKRAREPLPEEPAPAHEDSGIFLYKPWTERQWQTAPLEECKSRLALLKADFECGSRMVGQRPDVNDPHSYHCLVCKKLVAESKWSWKQDYLNPVTAVFDSVVTCSQYCSTVMANDPRLQQHIRDLIKGKVTSNEPEVVADEEVA